MSSPSRVLSIPELLDNILHYSAPKDLFCQQRVNKTWQALIQTSTPLQDKMFFRSAVREHKDREDIAYKSYGQAVVAEWNPFLAPFVRHALQKNSHLGCIIDPNALRNLELACPNATWTKMVITKPALQRMNIFRNDSELLVPVEPLRNNDGITLGDLSQAAIRHESHWYLASQGPKVTIPDYYFQLNPAVVVFSGTLTLLAVSSSGSAAVISPSNPISQNHQLPANLSIPGRLTTENIRFGIRGHFGEENLNIISLLMNTVNGLANLAHQPSQKRIPGFHVDILPWYANIDISIQPVIPARDIEVQVAVDALYYSLYNMIVNKVFKNAAFDILWDGNLVGQMKIDKAAGPSQTVNGVSNTSQITTEPNTLVSNDTTAVDLTTNTRLLDGGLSLYYHYPPNGERMSFQEVFITLMAALKNLGRFPSTQVVEPFRTGARGFNARMQFFGDETPRTEPPFLTYALLIDTVRQIPFYIVDRKKFAELQTVITFDDVLLGEAVLERGSPELGGAGTCENSSKCDVSSS